MNHEGMKPEQRKVFVSNRFSQVSLSGQTKAYVTISCARAKVGLSGQTKAYVTISCAT